MASKKLLAFPSFLFLLQLSVAVNGQQSIPLISLSVKNWPLAKVLDSLERKTGYAPFGDAGWTEQARDVTVVVKNASLKQVLDICFKDQPLLTYDLVGKNISIRPRESRDSTVSGKIVNEKGEPVPGATVTIKGSRESAMSNEQGEFSIRVRNNGAGLIISSINYETQELRMMAGKDTLVQMKPRIIEMDVSIVHTGYQVIPKERATGSFGKIDNDLIDRRVSANILDRLDGVTGGLLFNKNIVLGTNQAAISIRGRSTIFANPEPLIVIDNFPYNGNIYNINPDDVESVTVLKDAAAASIWGAFAGNGVIVITTKKGRFNQAPRLEFNTSLTVGRKPDLYSQPILSTSDYIGMEEYLFNTGNTPGLGNPQNQALSPVAAILNAEANGILLPSDTAAQLNILRGQDTRRDLGHYFYRNSLNQQYSLNVSGGSANNQYFLSAGYDKDLSGMVRNEYDRVTLNGNNTYILIPKKFDLSTGFAFTSSTFTDDNTGMLPVAYPYLKLADAKGGALPVPYLHDPSYIDTAGGGQLLDWNYRPLDELRNADNVTRLSDYRINIRLHYAILKGLDAFGYYQYSKGSSNLQNFQSQQVYSTRNLINEFTHFGAGMPIRAIPLGGILDETDSGYQANNLRFQLNYDHLFSWGCLNAIAGSELRDIEGSYSSTRLYGYDNDLRTSQGVDYTTPFAQYTSPPPSAQIPYLDHSTTTSDHYLSYYFNGSYNWQEKYILSASVRKDESNIFGVNANRKGVPLWSAGAAWEVSRESFYHADKWLPYLKLRLTDGYNGNVDKTVSAYTTAVINPPGTANGLPTATIINPTNPFLQWEKIHILNVGIEFGTKDRRVEGSLEYYFKNGEDLIGPTPLDPTTGNSQLIGNFASMKTHGLDISLRTKYDLGPVHWNAILLFSYTRDRVTRYSLKEGAVGDYFNPNFVHPFEGRPLYSIYAFKWEGLSPDKGDPQGLVNGKISTGYDTIINTSDLGNLVYVGPANPPVFGSLRNSFSWKQFEFSFNITYKFGYYFRRPSIDYYDLFIGSSPGYPDFDKRWQMPGDEKRTKVPSIAAGTGQSDQLRNVFYSNSEILIEKGDHIRLQDIQLSYDLPASALSRLPLQSIRFYLYANNIGILWRANHEGIDPDYTNSNIPNLQTRSLAVGLKMDF